MGWLCAIVLLGAGGWRGEAGFFTRMWWAFPKVSGLWVGHAVLLKAGVVVGWGPQGAVAIFKFWFRGLANFFTNTSEPTRGHTTARANAS